MIEDALQLLADMRAEQEDRKKPKRLKRTGNPHFAFRLDRDLAEYLKAQPEGIRAYLTRLIKTDKDNSGL